MRKNILLTMLLLTSTAYAQVVPMDKESFTTIDLINESLPALFDCSHYCIVGVELRMIIVPPGVIKTFRTPVIRHNTADLIAMSAMETSEMPWLEYRNIFARLVKKLGDSLLRSLVGVSVFEVGGGQTEYADYGAHQSVNFKDADIMGNPLAYVVEKLDAKVNSGNVLSNSEIVSEDPEAEENQIAVEDFLGSFMSNNDTSLSEGVFMMLGGPIYKELVMNHPITQVYDQAVRTLVNEFASMDQMVVEYYGCDTVTQPYKPYYFSNLDGYFWRDGFPITDPHMIKDMINPLSKNIIKPSSEFTEIGGIDLNIMSEWGALFPRSGFLNHAEDHKHGAVVTARAMSIVTDPLPTRIRQFAGGAYHEILWQPLHPIVETACYQNIANSVSDMNRNLKRNYAWNAWRRYECSLSNLGIPLGRVYFPDLMCIGNGPKDITN